MVSPSLPLTAILQQARKARRWSQLELALRVGVSQRHLSFVESGRARPSRELLIAWLQTLDTPLGVRNAALLQAGFAPLYSAAPWTDPALGPARDALRHLLRGHDPMPALVLDVQWNAVELNRGAQWLATTLMPWIRALPSDAPLNLVDLFMHPEGFCRTLLNLQEVGPAMLAHLRDDATVQPELAPRVDAFAAFLRTRVDARSLQWGSPLAPLVTSRFASPHGELAFFSMFTTFGRPQDITLASLRVEHMFAADDTTRQIVVAALGQDAPPSD